MGAWERSQEPAQRNSNPARGRFRPVVAWSAALVSLASCGLGEGDGGLPPEPPQIPLEEGQSVGAFEVVIPNSDFFILRGTLPVQKGTFDPDDGVEPFGVVDATGETYGAQAEVVSWYPNDAVDGADVVEITARVSRGDLPMGTRTTYRVVLASHPAEDPGTAGVEDLYQGPLAIPTLVESFLSNPGGIEIRSYDCYGNRYMTYPLNGAGEERLLRYGEHTAELALYQKLAPAPPVTSGSEKTLTHFLGVHCYISSWNSEEIVGLDLRVTNADSGNIALPEVFVDDPLDKVYFRNLEVAVPNGWVVVQDFDDPFVGGTTSSGGMSVFEVVEPMPGGDLHVLPWGWQFHRRLAICRVGAEQKARDLLRGAGLGFARAGLAPEGHDYFSWWNPVTPRYFPQSHILPVFDHLGLDAVISALVSERDKVKGFLENGTTAGDYPVDSVVMGWAHPYGIAYGGMTGGAEIFITDGMKTAWAADLAGYQKFRIIHRMQSDRQHNVLYNWDGQPTAVKDWVKTSAAGTYVPFEMFVQPQLSSQDAFGLYLADQSQIDYVESSGLKPDYEGELLGWDAHDYQHYIRYTHSAKVLAWLANDSLAKDDLKAQAENFRLAYHEHNNSSGGAKQGSGFKSAKEFVAANPGVGFGLGRGESWGIDCNNAAYALGTRTWRAERKPWFDQLADTISDGQANCSGFLQAVLNDKILDGEYRARQAYEHPIINNAICGMVERVFRGKDSGRTAMLEDVLRDSYYALIGPISWGAGEHSPWQMTAVTSKSAPYDVYCSAAELPGDAWTPGAYETFQNWSDFAFAYELTGDLEFLDRAALQIGSPDLLVALESSGLNNIENRSSLLAILQYENGDF
jgi:hypothetical protein